MSDSKSDSSQRFPLPLEVLPPLPLPLEDLPPLPPLPKVAFPLGGAAGSARRCEPGAAAPEPASPRFSRCGARRATCLVRLPSPQVRQAYDSSLSPFQNCSGSQRRSPGEEYAHRNPCRSSSWQRWSLATARRRPA